MPDTEETAYVAVVPRETTDDYDPKAMGVAVVGVLYDGTVYYFGEDDLPRLFDLLRRAERFVGVNDYIVDALEPYADEGLTPFIGVQSVVSDALGERVSLNNISKATLGREREDPRRLPLEWSEGRKKTVKRALKKDLLILRDLDKAVREGDVRVTDPRTMEERDVETGRRT
ncbi:MAG: hypothetical protein U5J64_01125 [Halobacteriales archaeon]|nr:hypothetical protein [Halobacteriales archaeon]